MRFKWRRLLPWTLGGPPKTNIYRLLFDNDRKFCLARKPLWDRLSELKPDRVMEIGFGTGKNALKISEILPRSEIWILDILDEGQGSVPYRAKSWTCFCKLRKKEGVNFVFGDSRKTLGENKFPKMDFIIIDGGHSLDVVRSDWEHSKELMAEGGEVWFHDYDLEGVKKVVDSIDGYDIEIIKPKVGPPFARVGKK